MRLGKRQRADERPFAGLHDVSTDPNTLSLAVYGIAATLHPIDQAVDDEGSELVPLPGSNGSSTDPVLVDRFDCRLLLEPEDLVHTTTSGRASTAFQENTADAALEAELDDLRWRDFFNPPHLHHHHDPSEDDGCEQEQRKRSRGAAIPFTYSNPIDTTTATGTFADGVDEDGQRVYYLEDLEPPPPPLYLEPNRLNPSLISLLKSAQRSDSGLPFTARSYAIMQRTAEFLHLCKDHGGAEILYQRAFSDPTFAFLSPSHVWNNFFQGLVERLSCSTTQQQERDRIEGQEAPEQNSVRTLLAAYDSEEEEEEGIEKKKEGKHHWGRWSSGGWEVMKEVTKTIISRLLKLSNQHIALKVREEFFNDPIIGCIFNSKGDFYNDLKHAVEGAVAAGEMDDQIAAVWLEKKATIPVTLDTIHPEKVNKIEEGNEEEKLDQALPAAAPVITKKERKIRKATTAIAPEVDESKKEERKQKAKLLLERQRQVAEERRQGQAVAKQQAEEERNQHLAAISVHKRMFLDTNSDDE